MDSNADFIQRLDLLGVGFTISHEGPEGRVTLGVFAEQLQRFVDDPAAWLAAYYEVSADQYLAWHRSSYNVLCCASRNNGQPCKGIVPGGSRTKNPKTWLQMLGGYCVAHGADSERRV